MIIDRIHSILWSVITRHLVILVITWVAVNIIVLHTIVEFHNIKYEKPVRSNIGRYVMYIVNDLGSPPTLERARELGEKLSLHIVYEGPSGSWSTSDAMPSIAEFAAIDRSGSEVLFSVPEPGTEVWHLDMDYNEFEIPDNSGPEDNFWRVKNKEGQFLFKLTDLDAGQRQRAYMLATLITMLSVLTLLAYLAIRWILKPLGPLSEGVRQVSLGNLDHRIDVKRRDELGELARAFNDMTARIREMLNAREQLLLDVSHELRSPITRMKVALEFVDDTETKETLREDLSEMEMMVTEILESARLRNKHTQLDRRPVDLVDLVRDAAGLFQDQPPGVRISRMPEAAVIQTDEELVKTVLKNILSNAVKYSGEENEPVRVRVSPDNGHTTIRVEDKGIGIPKNELPYIFEPFYRVDKSRSKETGGYGLGLSLCKTIMDALHGRIEIESSPAAGTTVSLIFPVSAPDLSK